MNSNWDLHELSFQYASILKYGWISKASVFGKRFDNLFNR
jgi:hypothetical protein